MQSDNLFSDEESDLEMKSSPGKMSKKKKSNLRQNFSERKSRKRRCGECEGCKRQNCGECIYCKDSKRFGGPNKMKQACKERTCENKNYSKTPTQREKKLTTTIKSSGRNKNLKKILKETAKNSSPMLPSTDGESQDHDQGMNESLEIGQEIDNPRSINFNEFNIESVKDEKNQADAKPSTLNNIIDEEMRYETRVGGTPNFSTNHDLDSKTKKAIKKSKRSTPIIESDEDIAATDLDGISTKRKYKPRPKSKQARTISNVMEDLKMVPKQPNLDDKMSGLESEIEFVDKDVTTTDKNPTPIITINDTEPTKIPEETHPFSETPKMKRRNQPSKLFSSKKPAPSTSDNESDQTKRVRREDSAMTEEYHVMFSKQNDPIPFRLLSRSKHSNDETNANTSNAEKPINNGNYNNTVGKNAPKFTKEQNKYLKASFDTNPSLNPKERKRLSTKLHIAQSKVLGWFQNQIESEFTEEQIKVLKEFFYNKQYLTKEEKDRLSRKLKIPNVRNIGAWFNHQRTKQKEIKQRQNAAQGHFGSKKVQISPVKKETTGKENAFKI